MQDLLTLAEAANLLPKRNGKKIHACSIWRWCRKGIRGVVLRTVPVGAVLFTTAEYVEEFLAALQQERTQRHAIGKQIAQRFRQRSASASEAMRGLRAMGLAK